MRGLWHRCGIARRDILGLVYTAAICGGLCIAFGYAVLYLGNGYMCLERWDAAGVWAGVAVDAMLGFVLLSVCDMLSGVR